jgi:hypothetical protein
MNGRFLQLALVQLCPASSQLCERSRPTRKLLSEFALAEWACKELPKNVSYYIVSFDAILLHAAGARASLVSFLRQKKVLCGWAQSPITA